jgi:hypothetical protein
VVCGVCFLFFFFAVGCGGGGGGPQQGYQSGHLGKEQDNTESDEYVLRASISKLDGVYELHSVELWSTLLQLASFLSPDLQPLLNCSGQVSTLSDLLSHLKPFPCLWLTNFSDDGGGKHL